MAGRKNFVAGEILTAADVNSFLMDQSVMVFDDSAARTTAIPTPSEGMVTYLKDSNQVQAFDGSAFRPVGGILQVLSTTKVDAFSTTSASLTDITGLAVSITPSFSTSKVFVVASVMVGHTTTNVQFDLDIARDGTAVSASTAGSSRNAMSGARDVSNDSATAMSASVQFLDSPSSTSALTYSLRINRGSSGTVHVNRRSTAADFGYVSTITVMEVAV